MPSSSARTVDLLENARARNQDVANVGVDGICVSTEHVKLNRAVAFGCLGMTDGGPADRHSHRNVACAESVRDAHFSEPSRVWKRWPRQCCRPLAVMFDGAATLRLNS
jgi:hypothetical protein